MDGQQNKALEYAARLLAPRAMSEQALRDKLESKGRSEERRVGKEC